MKGCLCNEAASQDFSLWLSFSHSTSICWMRAVPGEAAGATRSGIAVLRRLLQGSDLGPWAPSCACSEGVVCGVGGGVSCFQRWPRRVGDEGGAAGYRGEAALPRHSAQRKAHSTQGWRCATRPSEQTSGRSESPAVWRWAEGKGGLKSSLKQCWSEGRK